MFALKNYIEAKNLDTFEVEYVNALDCINAAQLNDGGGVASLSKCQVDTPETIVQFVWGQILARRLVVHTVADFGCGDGRFANFGTYDQYDGFEIDPARISGFISGANKRIHTGCAFELASPSHYDVCIGNPPYIKHHDLSSEWLVRIEQRLESMIDYVGDGRSNAYIYFLWLSLASVRNDGLVALVIPFEWISRPASASLRAFIRRMGWAVDVYFLQGSIFDRVLTTACVAIVDKSIQDGRWQTHSVSPTGEIAAMAHPTMTENAVLEYEKAEGTLRAIRGLSPGGQEVFVLTEEERIRFRLVAGRDVVPAITTFRYLDKLGVGFSEAEFRAQFVNKGRRCWLINTDGKISAALTTYLEQVPLELRGNSTCSSRGIWWKYSMPKVAKILYASGFAGSAPKMIINDIGAIHVGGVHGIHCSSRRVARILLDRLKGYDFASRVVAQAKGFKKIEVNQMNSVLNKIVAL